MRTGIANLPLHHGKMPPWLFNRMKKLAREISYVIVYEFGPDAFLKKLSDPFWFQAFGCVLGFDWHSSGLTTTVCGALKGGLKDVDKELGIYIAGGKGATSRKTPSEIEKVCNHLAHDAKDLIYASRMTAKVDNTALQDGYQLYHHNFIFTGEGKWAVIQQGMNETTRFARRYHWLAEELDDFVCEPHKAVCCDQKGKVLNLVAKESDKVRRINTQIANQSPDLTIKDLEKIKKLHMPSTHYIDFEKFNYKRLKKILLSTYEKKPENFEALLGIEGVGSRTLRALTLISELIYKQLPSFRDPVKYSFAVGGKDGHPYPVNKKTYDESIQILHDAVRDAKIERYEKIKAIKRLKNSFIDSYG